MDNRDKFIDWIFIFVLVQAIGIYGFITLLLLGVI